MTRGAFVIIALGALACEREPTAKAISGQASPDPAALSSATPSASRSTAPPADSADAAKPEASTSTLAAPTPRSPAASMGAFQVAEWGLMVYEPARQVAAKPKPKPLPTVRESPPVIKKPVIYLVPQAEWSWSQAIQVKATLRGAGRMREVWPTPGAGAQPEHGPSFTWSQVRLKPDPCAPGWGATARSAACASLGEGAECEAAELEAWIPVTTRCLDVQGQPAGALLYNGTPDRLDSPLVQRKPGQWEHVGAHALGPLLVAYQGRLYPINRLEPGATLSLVKGPRPEPVPHPAEWVQRWVGALGLSPAQTADFMRAWRPLLDSPAEWSVFGFLGPEAIEALATLEVDPEPSQIKRVMAFVVQARPSPRAARLR